jgi:hypothetical protein
MRSLGEKSTAGISSHILCVLVPPLITTFLRWASTKLRAIRKDCGAVSFSSFFASLLAVEHFMDVHDKRSEHDTDTYLLVGLFALSPGTIWTGTNFAHISKRSCSWYLIAEKEAASPHGRSPACGGRRCIVRLLECKFVAVKTRMCFTGGQDRKRRK